MTWRDKARPIVAKVLADSAGKSEAEVKQAIFGAYPFGPREYHPYKIWLDEVRRQRGLKPSKKKLTARQLEQAEMFEAQRAPKEAP